MKALNKIINSTLIIIFFLYTTNAFCQKRDYVIYHNAIIEAEKFIFIDNNSIKGLRKFDETFKECDYVFIDDCIEAFQLALVFDHDTFAYKFIEKAIKNGFQIDMLKYLNIGYLNLDIKDSIKLKKVTIYENFIDSHKEQLDSLTSIYYPEYINRMKKNKDLISLILKRHIIEQLYKQNEKKIVYFNSYPKTYLEISDENLLLLLKFFKDGDFLGERNLGIYSDKFSKDIGIRPIKEFADSILNGFKYNSTLNRVPYIGEEDYFGASPLFIILFHNPNSFQKLKPFAEKAISEGYLHPREYALLLRGSSKPKNLNILYKKIRIEDIEELPNDTSEINKARASMHLPPFEVDYFKNKFQNKNNVQSFFGFLGRSK